MFLEILLNVIQVQLLFHLIIFLLLTVLQVQDGLWTVGLHIMLHHILEIFISKLLIKDLSSNKVLLKGALKDGLYQLDLEHVRDMKNPVTSAISCNTTALGNTHVLWHNRLGHPCSATLSKVFRSLNLSSSIPSLEFYESCRLGKMHQQHFSYVSHATTTSLELIHMDVWGPASLDSIEGFKYFLIIVDDYTRYS